MPRRDAEGKLVRPPRADIPPMDSGNLDSIMNHTRFWLDRVAELAGYCMTDNLDNPGVIRDCHDIIGALSAASNGLSLAERKANEQRPLVDGDTACCEVCLRWVPHNGKLILNHGRDCSGSYRPVPQQGQGCNPCAS